MGWGGVESLLNACARLDAQLRLVLDLEVGSRLDYEYSVTQLTPGDYCCVKWWDDGPVSRAGPRKSEKSSEPSTGV